MIANAKRANASDEDVTVTSVAIADQITRELLPTTGRRQLVGDPFRRWVRCDAEPEDLSPAVAHDQQPVEQSEGDGRNHEQIHRRDPICVVAEKRLLALRRRTSPAHHILGNAGLPDVDPELEQFAMDTRYTPQRVGQAHFPDKLPDLSRHRWPARTRPRFPAPVTSETCAMPAHHGIGSNDGERVAGV